MVTDAQRHEMILNELKELNRVEDYDCILSCLGPPQNITTIANPGRFKGVKVGIIGAGAAGLAAAFELRKLGFDIKIFEATNRIGGRIRTYYFDKSGKYYGELGPMRIPVSHETTWHYINMFKLTTTPFIQSSPEAFKYVRGVRVRNDPNGEEVSKYIYPQFPMANWETKVPWTDLFDYVGEGLLLTIPPEIRKELLQTKPKYDSIIEFWDYTSTRKAMEMLKLSDGAIDMLSSVDPMTFGFWYDSHIEILNEYMGLVFSNLYKVVGGFSRLPFAFYNSLTSPNPTEYGNISNSDLGNVTFKLNHPVEGIYQGSDNSVILRSRNTDSKKLKDESFDYVICAIPFSALRTVDTFPLFSQKKFQAIRETYYVNAQKTLLLCNKRFWQEDNPSGRIVGGGSFTDLPIASIWYPDYAPNDTPGVLLASYNVSKDADRIGNLPIERRVDLVMRQVEEVHGLRPGYLDSIVDGYASINWRSEPYELGCFLYFQPEQKRLFSYSMITPEYDNRLFFAGEHTSNSHGWQNGAYQTGMIAANDIATECLRR
ncbi:amine oxidase [Gottschalkia acidurici 9a]|uniref:Amine oxidase n=1 Tax=Gottschalkia acidurici (strain ATCC 7906 / DSM 604 / BCRC 14475 / CIP 104303 / KCTC 5404 / NCIMB 10678 / 9a) TaxID=1128398 RepID=K0AVD8_GOTA9|nr:NAD(P)/FAD-dependent oxidoreductase [Gottschalkia acidurici]AFS77244.1 amine oxidase [Gottschalkia acidurici 9a]